MIADSDTMPPQIVTACSGATVNEVNPSIASFISFQ